ncbi:MAG TPA: HAD family hydrolase [Terriglobia bacterium]|nr:HAD family hydrolase [Terriglobia bacterium]
MHNLAFLVDVDNTLLDNDWIERDLKDHLERNFGLDACKRYWTILEDLRGELGYADFLGALQRYRLERVNEPRLLLMSSFLVDYPFADRLYPKALQVLRHLSTMGLVVIVSDGDAVFQPRKVDRSGIWAAVEGRVLIYVHKEEMLDDIEHHYSATRYVFIDDKLRLLTAVKKVWGDRVTTIFPRQGHYAHDPEVLRTYPAADITVAHIAELLNYVV